MIDQQKKPYVDNAANSKQVKKATDQVRRDLEQKKEDLSRILQTGEGRRTFWRYLSLCGIYRESFTGSSETFYLEGKRSVGLVMLKDIMDADPNAYLKMIEENRKENSNV